MRRVLALLVGTVLVGACSGSAAPSAAAPANRVIAYPTYSMENAATLAFQQGIIDRATPLGYTVTTVNSNADVQKQANQSIAAMFVDAQKTRYRLPMVDVEVPPRLVPQETM